MVMAAEAPPEGSVCENTTGTRVRVRIGAAVVEGVGVIRPWLAPAAVST
jgi:hypothetical protein